MSMLQSPYFARTRNPITIDVAGMLASLMSKQYDVQCAFALMDDIIRLTSTVLASTVLSLAGRD